MTKDDAAQITAITQGTEEKIQVVYADTDTLSSFMNRNSFEYFMKVFETLGAEVILSKAVYHELCNGNKKEIRKATVKQLERSKRITVVDIEPFTEVADTYLELSERMGKGEASALAFAKHSTKKTVVASNNMSDVAAYAKEHSIELWPTAKILEEAIKLQIINMNQANTLWIKMKEDGLKLPSYNTFEEYCKR